MIECPTRHVWSGRKAFTMRSNNINKLYKALVGVLIAVMMTGLAACSQAPKVLTIGFLNIAPSLELAFQGFRDGMKKLGYVDGQNVNYIYGGAATTPDSLSTQLKRIMQPDVDLIVCISTPA